MNNEEKILEALEKLTQKVDRLESIQEEMKASQEELKASQEEMKASQEEMRGDISQMQETLTRVAVTQEGVVLPRIQLALEGHAAITQKLETLSPKERVEVLEDEVSAMKAAMKMMMKRLDALEKAQ